MMRSVSIVLLALALTASPAWASSQPSSSPADTGLTPVLATYWDGFMEHWAGHLKKQNGVIMFALGVGALSLFIITRGKWNK